MGNVHSRLWAQFLCLVSLHLWSWASRQDLYDFHGIWAFLRELKHSTCLWLFNKQHYINRCVKAYNSIQYKSLLFIRINNFSKWLLYWRFLLIKYKEFKIYIKLLEAPLMDSKIPLLFFFKLYTIWNYCKDQSLQLYFFTIQ